MANHAGSLRAISFLGNESVSQPVHRPSNDLVALDRGVVEADLPIIDLNSARSDSDRVGCHHKARSSCLRRGRLQLVSDEGSTFPANAHESRALETVRPILARGRRRRWQSQGKRQLRFKPFIERLLRVGANIKRETSLSVLPVSTNGEFGKRWPREWRW